MPPDKRLQEQLAAYCGQLGDDDCIDPRDYFAAKPSQRKGQRKARQLCRQVGETLELVLTGDCADELLQSLHVVSVDPAPDVSRLLVTFGTDLPEERVDHQDILDRLAAQTGRLRCEIATAITRKRVPTLTFCVVGPSAAGESP